MRSPAPDPLRRESSLLEQEARRVANEIPRRADEFAIHLVPARQIRLTLEFLDRSREAQHRIRFSLLEDECRLDTELRRLEQQSIDHPGRHSLLARLQGINEQRRRLDLTELEAENALFSELQKQLERVRQLSPPDED